MLVLSHNKGSYEMSYRAGDYKRLISLGMEKELALYYAIFIYSYGLDF